MPPGQPVQRAVPVVAGWADAIFLALTNALNDLLLFVPRLLGALVILLVGWLLAKAVEALATKGLRAVRFNQVADRAELDQFLDRAGVRLDPAAVVGKLAYWFLLLIFIGAAFNAFGLTQVTAVINQIVAYLPNVVVALVVLLVGALLATFAGNLVRGASGSARVGDPGLLAGLARAAVLAFAVLIALNQLQIGEAIVNTLFMAVVGMLALAGALAFGLGGREVAGRILEDWYAKRGEAAAKAGRLADAARRESPSANGASRSAATTAPAAPAR
jgi:Mechanosensitive ion channel, conserved TM helix